MTLSHSTGLSNFAADSGFGTAFDTNGRLAIYSGSPPAAGAAVGGKASPANEIATGTLLGTLTLSADAFAAAANGGACALNAVTSDTSADATASAGYFVMYLSTGTALTSRATASDRRMMGTVGTSGADMTIDVAAVITGGTLALSAWSWTWPA